jgi:hypothetical protein
VELSFRDKATVQLFDEHEDPFPHFPLRRSPRRSDRRLFRVAQYTDSALIEPARLNGFDTAGYPNQKARRGLRFRDRSIVFHKTSATPAGR